MYKKIKINRLWHGFASVRDYQVEDACTHRQGLEIWWDTQYIRVPYNKLDKHFKNDETFKSKHRIGQKYSLVDFDWKDFKDITSYDNQLTLL